MSVTVTWSGAMLSTLAETRLVTAWICSPERVVPGARSSSTAAVGSACSVTKTSSLGRATLTMAWLTPSRASSVRESSPSIARLYVTCCWNSLLVMPCSSSSA